jgi:hypothetical protein
MTDVNKRIEQLETQAADATLLAKIACEPATRTYNAMRAEDLMALVKTLRASGVVARAT